MKWQHKQFPSAWNIWVKNKWSMNVLVGIKKNCSQVERENVSGFSLKIDQDVLTISMKYRLDIVTE